MISYKRFDILKHKMEIIRLIIIAGIIGLVFLFDYKCIYLTYLHIPCLGCGMTRAWKAALTGHLRRAFQFHRAFWTVPILCYYVWKGGRIFKKNIYNIMVMVMILLLFIENYIHYFI